MWGLTTQRLATTLASSSAAGMPAAIMGMGGCRLRNLASKVRTRFRDWRPRPLSRRPFSTICLIEQYHAHNQEGFGAGVRHRWEVQGQAVEA